MKLLVTVKGAEAKFGPISCCIIAVDNNVLRNFNIDLIIKSGCKNFFEDMGDKHSLLKHYYIKKYDAKDVKDVKTDVANLVFECINSYHKFWDTKVYVDTKSEPKFELLNISDEIKHLLDSTQIRYAKRSFNKKLYKLVDYIHGLYYDTEIRMLKNVYPEEKGIHERK